MGVLNNHPSLKNGYVPGSTPDTQAHDWSDISCGPTGLTPLNDSITDSYGRVCLLRGANVSGGSKIPINHNPATFPHDHRSVTFVGRPFSLEEAPQHFARLRRWGLTFIRFNVTWEAIEHEGPGKYDTEYLDYLQKLLSLLPEFGIVAFVSLHQDVWSRYSGGSGAPAWTLEVAGFDLGTIGGECGAAYLGGVQGNGVEVDRGRWPTGYQKLAASTMATLFWAGSTFAPKLRVKSRSSEESVNIQDFLQDHFLDAFDQLVRAVGVKAWRSDGPAQGKCIWEMHGVWGWDIKKREPVPLREHYFERHPDTGAEIEWHEDFFYPFIKRWASRVHELTNNSKMLFLEAIPNEFCPKSWTPENQPHKMVFAPHWYDLNALFSKEFGSMSVNVQGLSRGMFILRALYWGHSGARENYTLQIRNIVENARKSLSSSRPVIIGECGIPMDMNHGEGFKVESYKWHLRMMDALMASLERNFVGFTLWNYNPLNDDAHGDSWNGENFSWFSQSRADPHLSSSTALVQSNKALDTGARLLPVLVRPYPAKVAGYPVEFVYEPFDGSFTFIYRVPNSGPTTSMRARETEIFLPAELASNRKLVIESDGSNLEWSYDPERQTLFVVHSSEGLKTLKVSFDPPLHNEFVETTPKWIQLLSMWFVLVMCVFILPLVAFWWSVPT
ncbi:unnamed protein product [Rhizoctonia solani]|uniref:Glycoside hydrolase family 5 C-terminal domain-containing protein n=1 Tax=Rhizoctonia solani TaxID=456999 RepID=A0A8H3GP79_9AGAM|nr:unnamed protein product [Rhizoctonia solani]